jgi:predicted nucleotidyltransferase component of viral defense system
MHLHKDNQAFIESIEVVADDKGIPEEYVIKDYFVSLLLNNILQEAPNIVFKGGTSLSKCYRVIERFSEDIDINLKVDSKASNKEKKDLKEGIIRAIEKSEMILNNTKAIKSRKDFNKYEVEYSSEIEVGEILRPHLLIESFLTLKSFPCEIKPVHNYIFDYLFKKDHHDFIKKYELEPFDIHVQSIRRTFIDKLFAICDYHEDKAYTQTSRHLYDLHKIHENFQFSGEEFTHLFYEVAVERRKSKKSISSFSGYPFRKTLKNIVENDHYKGDYYSNTQFLLFEETAYQTVKNSITEIIDLDFIPENVE